MSYHTPELIYIYVVDDAVYGEIVMYVVVMRYIYDGGYDEVYNGYVDVYSENDDETMAGMVMAKS